MDDNNFFSKFYHEPQIRLLNIGDMLPRINLSNGINIYNLITDHLFLGIYDINCAECIDAIEELYEFIEDYPKLNTVLLINAENNQSELISKEFVNKAQIFNYKLENMITELNTNSFPQGYTINALGQIVHSRAAVGRINLEKLISPFKNYSFFGGK